MKKFILISFICMSISAFGQQVDFGFSVGSGKSYLFESLDKGVNVNYGLPMSIISEAKFTPKQQNWGIKLRLHSIESTLKGENWVSGVSLNGHINSFTTSLLLEKEITKNKYSYGFNFGFGLTKETIHVQQYWADKTTKNYTSFTISQHISFKLNKDLDFQISPILLLQDPFKCFGVMSGSLKPDFAGEDLTLLVNVGLRYKLIK